MIQVRRQARFLLAAIALALLAACAGDVDHLAVREQVGDARVVLLSTEWCGYCRRLRAQLDDAGIGYDVVDIEDDTSAAEFVETVNGGNQVVPTVRFADGSTATNPSVQEVRERLAS